MTTTIPGLPIADQFPLCDSCGSTTAPESRFCAHCGVARSSDAFDDAGLSQPGRSPITDPEPSFLQPEQQGNGRRRFGVIAAVVALGLLLTGGTAAWALKDSPAEQQQASAYAALATALDSLASADSTADLRATGASVAGMAATTGDFLAALPVQDRPVALADTSEALTTIATLSTVAGDAADSWVSGEDVLRGIAHSTDTSVAALGPAAGDAADQVDAVVSAAQDEYREWARDNAREVRARDTAIAEATTYQARVAEYLDQYATLRTQLNDYIETVDTVGSTMDEGYQEFSAAAQGRRAVRAGLAALTPPADAARAHDRLLSVLDDGIAAVEAAERALDVAECGIYGCDVVDQPAWAQFRSESKRITSSFASAADAVRADAQSALGNARAITLADKPVF